MAGNGAARQAAIESLIGVKTVSRSATTPRHSALEGHTGKVAKPRARYKVRRPKIRRPRIRG